MSENSEKMFVRPDTFDKFETAILKDVWSLPGTYAKLIQHKMLYITTVEKFLKYVTKEHFPATYEDTISLKGGRKYFVSYIFCSREYLTKLAAKEPNTPVAIQLRANCYNDFYYSLVRLFDRKWTVDSLKKNGAIEL